jgi:hypothetical protein
MGMTRLGGRSGLRWSAGEPQPDHQQAGARHQGQPASPATPSYSTVTGDGIYVASVACHKRIWLIKP